MRTIALTMMIAGAAGLFSACGTEDDNNGSTNNGEGTNNGTATNNGAGTNNGGGNNGAANNGTNPSGSCFHNCVSEGPLGDIESFGCVAPSSDGDCATDGQNHCDSAGFGTMTVSEYVADCASCDESCAPDFYDCSSATCITNTN